MYLVGIDGGGTSCRARIRTSEGALVGEGVSGSANLLLGVNIAMSSIIEAVTLAAQHANLGKQHFSLMHVGAALAGAEQKSAWQAFMSLPHPFASMTLNTDAFGACLGAHNGRNGAIMIGGTGSCGLLLNNGEQFVVGGREFPISDQGGGAVMGLRLIQQVLLAEDGIRKKTALCEHVMTHFNHDVDAIVEWSKTAIPAEYGQFSKKIFELAYQGDGLANELLRQTAADLDMYIRALINKGAQRVCLMGSIAERLHEWLGADVKRWIVEPEFDAIEGAIMFAGKPEHNLYLKDVA